MSRPKSYIAEFNSLAELAGINMAPSVTKIINELLAMSVAPEMIYEILKNICPLSMTSNVENEK